MFVHPAAAIPTSDPYADAVDASSVGLNYNPSNAIGAPDGNTALVVSTMGSNLTLDMGAGEEGTDDLVLYYGQVTVNVVVPVQFLDAQHNLIASNTPGMAVNVVQGFRALVTYPARPTPYRYVRFLSVASSYTIDAIEVNGDIDGDGLPNYWERQYNLDPFSATGNDGATGDPDNDGLTNAQEFAAGTSPRDADTDRDGLPDGWEVYYTLNPLDATGENGATGDPDNDGLTNTQEFVAGTNPRVASTPEPTATATDTPEPTTTNTPEPTATTTNTPEPTATATDTPEPTATATDTPEPTDRLLPRLTHPSQPLPCDQHTRANRDRD